MKRTRIISIGLIVWFLLPVLAGAQPTATSFPTHNEDGSVTFVLHSPESRRVRLYCDCGLRSNKYNIQRDNLKSVRMNADGNGLFTYTTPPLAPEVYTYQFKTQGQRLVDP